MSETKQIRNKEHKESQVSRRKSRPLKWSIAIILLLAILLLFWLLPVFRIGKITVGKTMYAQPETIIAAGNLKLNQHFLLGYGGSLKSWLSGRYDQAAERISRAIPEVRSADVRFVFPSEIKIEIKERVAIGWLKIPDGCAVIDHEGFVLSILAQPPDQLPMIVGMQALNLKIGEVVKVDVPQDLQRAIEVMTALIEADYETQGDFLLKRVTLIEPTIDQEIRLTVVDGEQKFLVICNQNSFLVGHFSWLKRVINDGVMQARGSGTIDLRGKQRTYKPDPAGER